MELLIIFGVPGALGAYIIYTQHRERMEALKRGVSVPPSAPRAGNRSLFLGLLAIAVGVALIIPALAFWGRVDRDMLTGGLLVLSGGAAMLAYWKITAPDREKAKKMYELQLSRYLDQIQHTEKTRNDYAVDSATESETGEML